MSKSELIARISDKKVDVEGLSESVTKDPGLREDVVDLLLTDSHIMVYYHCYYILDRASRERPEFFYRYWDRFAPLLDHKNSYHRDIGMTLIANLVAVDEEERFTEISGRYFSHFNDRRFMTAQCCVRNTGRILAHREDLIDQVVHLLINLDSTCGYPPKQKELLKSDAVDVLHSVYPGAHDRAGIDRFIEGLLNSGSPKTRKRAKEFIRYYQQQPSPT